MKHPGMIVLFRFPHVDLEQGKLRPALLLGQLPGDHDDQLICMISSQLHHAVPDFDELCLLSDEDFPSSGLKKPSLIRIGRLAVVEGRILVGSLGTIAPARLQRIKQRLAAWLVPRETS